jgi:hypothetical protein
MKVEDLYVQQRRLWVRLHEKGGKRHEMPCHHNLEAYLHAVLSKALLQFFTHLCAHINVVLDDLIQSAASILPID